MNVREMIAQMSLEEKASLLRGGDFWHSQALERLGIPSIMLSDGPNGLRKQDEKADNLGINVSIKAVAFPTGAALASSFDRDLIRQVGAALGKEAAAERIGVLLGPAVNIKRSPLCGRNFEYLSEDPYLAGEMATAYIEGVQSQNVGTSLKHFALNNQEHERMSGSSEADERTIREIYFPAFEKAVKKAKPWTVMCSYNRINGTFASENPWLLTQVLRDEWGYEGTVVSDWGAVNDRVKGLAAGLDLEMPGGNPTNDGAIVKAVRDGQLSEEDVDRAVAHVLELVEKVMAGQAQDGAAEEDVESSAADGEAEAETAPGTASAKAHSDGPAFDREADHFLSGKVAEQCMVLLRNEDHVLPLKKQDDGIVYIGAFAQQPRFQGGGSSHINCWKVTGALDHASAYAPVRYAKGFNLEKDKIDKKLEKEAIALASEAKVAVIFAGLPEAFESEGYDRTDLYLPDCQNHLIDQICEVCEHVVVVLHNGSPVEMPWIHNVSAVLETYLTGEDCGDAVNRILFGEVNPSGKLAETFPLRLHDTPCYIDYPGKQGRTRYQEGVFVGYRYYDRKKMDVLFPFGHGLSYTSFHIGNMRTSAEKITDRDTLTVQVDVSNTGHMAGAEVVQLYVNDHTGTAIRPKRELKGFEKIYLQPGETKTVTFLLDQRSFAYYEPELHDWYAPSGEYRITVGSSSRKLTCKAVVMMESTKRLPCEVNANTLLGDLLMNEKTASYVREKLADCLLDMSSDGRGNKALQGVETEDVSKPQSAEAETGDGTAAQGAVSDEMLMATVRYMPIRALRSFGTITNGQVEQIVAELNEIIR